MRSTNAVLTWLSSRGLLVAVLGVLAAGHLLHLSASPVLTGSMTPTFAAGDAVLTRTEPVAELRVGQIALLIPPGQSTPFVHRIVSITGAPGHLAIRTKGDANSRPDPWTDRPTGPVVQEVLGSVPRAGRVLLLVHGPAGRALLIALLGLLLTALACRQILLFDGSPEPPAERTTSLAALHH